MVTQHPTSWVLMSYRIPRDPSTPRIAVWRKLKELGVYQVGDGLVALPNNARTKEHLEWIAAEVAEIDGEAIVWVAKTAAKRDSRHVVVHLNAAREAEYQELLTEIETGDLGSRAIGRLRRQWRRIDRRDYFGAPLRDQVRQSIGDLAQNESAVNDGSIGNGAITDRAITDRAINDDAITDRAITDRAINDDATAAGGVG